MNLVGRPSRMTAFDALYSIAAGDGRDEALFGDSFGIARGVYERTLIGDGYPTAYIEFPLLESPGFDLLTVHSAVRLGSRFAPGAGFGYQAMIDWFSGICDKGVSASCGIELDTSVGETERAGVYLQYRKHTDLIAPFLASIGEEVRAESYLAVADPTVPEYAEPCRNGGWQTSAGGSSPARRSLAMCRLTEKTDPGGRFALCRMFNYAKVKFAGTVAQPAKFYLRMSAGEVEA